MTCPTVVDQIGTFRRTAGRGIFSEPQAIVLMMLNSSLEQYRHEIQTPIDSFQSTGLIPKSVHYVVANTGVIYQFVSDFDTAWALDTYHNSTWPFVLGDVRTPYINIAIEGVTEGSCDLSNTQYRRLADLLCCLCMDHNIPSNAQYIITAHALNNNYDQILVVPDTLIAMTNACILRGGNQLLPNVVDLANDVAALKICCATNTARLNLVEPKVLTLQTQMASTLSRLAILEAWKPVIDNDLTQLRSDLVNAMSVFSMLQNRLSMFQGCIDKMCPEPNVCKEINYSTSNSTPNIVVPNVPKRINFPVRITDTTPPSVLPGPLWAAQLKCGCIWTVNVSVRLSPSEYCSGKSVLVNLHYCGSVYQIGSHATIDGVETVTIAGTFNITVPPMCDQIYVTVFTDDTSTPTKVVSQAEVQFICV